MNKMNEKNRYNESMMGILLFFYSTNSSIGQIEILAWFARSIKKVFIKFTKKHNFGLALFSRDEKSGNYKLNGHMDMSTMTYIN